MYVCMSIYIYIYIFMFVGVVQRPSSPSLLIQGPIARLRARFRTLNRKP